MKATGEVGDVAQYDEEENKKVGGVLNIHADEGPVRVFKVPAS